MLLWLANRFFYGYITSFGLSTHQLMDIFLFCRLFKRQGEREKSSIYQFISQNGPNRLPLGPAEARKEELHASLPCEQQSRSWILGPSVFPGALVGSCFGRRVVRHYDIGCQSHAPEHLSPLFGQLWILLQWIMCFQFFWECTWEWNWRVIC